MTAFASLGSGSRGNATLVDIGGELILVDCGFTLKQAEKRLRRMAVGPGDLSAIVVTHEHADHCGGVAALSHKYAIPVFASYGTLKAARTDLGGSAINTHELFNIGEVAVMPVIVPHDAREPTQFVFEHRGVRVGVISDLGQITPYVEAQYQHCNGLMMESNHDRQMLLRGRYPERVKRRIAGDLGHLSNEQAAGFLNAVCNPGLRVVIGHVSEENNHPDLLEETFTRFRDEVQHLVFADQDSGMDWVKVSSDGPVDKALSSNASASA
ncbi:MAG: MBL fold metallo-hydrolase [Gammaproteobacteria bacterium]|nr:MBL fold metallo-hydrolase [Gammaproteobacteria bacterium]